MVITKSFYLDINTPWKAPTLYIKQGDVDSRKLQATIRKDGTNYSIPGDVFATFRMHKPDDTFVTQDCTISGSVVSVVMDAQCATAAGHGKAEFVLQTASEVVSTFLLAIEILPSAVSDGDIESRDALGEYRTILEEMLRVKGAPLVANTAADMTDTDRVYVYTGSEVGYVNGDWYYYDGAGWTDGGQYNSPALPQVILDIQNNTDIGLFGVRWNRTNQKMIRLGAASLITTDYTHFAHRGTIDPDYYNPFDYIFPWSEMKVCNVDLTKYRAGTYTLKECITAYYGDPSFTYYGSDTLFVGRYRPTFWHKSEQDADGNVAFWVSAIERPGFKRADEAIDGISFAVDDGNGGVTAGAGVPLTGVEVSTIHTRAKNSGFTLQDIYAVDAQTILYLVEFADMNSQNAIGDGCSNVYRQNNADTISNITTADGVTTFTVTDSALSSQIYIGTQLAFGATSGATTYKGIVKSFVASGSVYTITLDRELALTAGMFMSVHGFDACEFGLLGQSLGNHSGYLGTNTKANAFYRGCVMYANRYQYTLGIYRQTGTQHIWLCPESSTDNYDGLNTAQHTDTGVALPAVSTEAWRWLGNDSAVCPGTSSFLIDGDNAPANEAASPVGDQQYVPLPTRSNTILSLGCEASGSGRRCGVFGGSWYFASSTSIWINSARLLLKKTL